MNLKDKKNCADCKSNVVKYCDGFILKDWTRYQGNVAALPAEPDQNTFWVYQECKKNAKGLKFLNLIGDCTGFERK